MIQLYWVPFYFAQLGFGSKSIIIGLTPSIRPLVGSIILMLISQYIPDKSKLTLIVMAIDFYDNGISAVG